MGDLMGRMSRQCVLASTVRLLTLLHVGQCSSVTRLVALSKMKKWVEEVDLWKDGSVYYSRGQCGSDRR